MRFFTLLCLLSSLCFAQVPKPFENLMEGAQLNNRALVADYLRANLQADESAREYFRENFLSPQNAFFKTEAQLDRWSRFFYCIDSEYPDETVFDEAHDEDGKNLQDAIEYIFKYCVPTYGKNNTAYINPGGKAHYQFTHRNSFPASPPPRDPGVTPNAVTTLPLEVELPEPNATVLPRVETETDDINLTEQSYRIAGHTRSTADGSYVAGIALTLTCGDETFELDSDDKGRFEQIIPQPCIITLLKWEDPTGRYRSQRYKEGNKVLKNIEDITVWLQPHSTTTPSKIAVIKRIERNDRRPIPKPGRITGELLADPKVLPGKKHVLIVLDGSGSMWESTGPLPSNDIYSLLQVGGKIYVGTDNGMAIMDTAGNVQPEVITTQQGLPNNFINSLLQVGGKIYVGTYEGIAIMDTAGNVQPEVITTAQGLPNNYINSLLQVGDKIYVGTDGRGMAIMDTGGNVQPEVITTQQGLPSNYIKSLLQVGGKIYVGTDNGMAIMDTAGNVQPKAITTEQGLPNNRILSLLQVGGKIYVGTFGGIAIMDTTGNVQPEVITTEQGLPNNYINSLLQVGGKIYVGTFGGIAIMDTAGNVQPEVITTAQGLPRNVIKSLLQVGDKIYVGTDNGIAIMEKSDGHWKVTSVIRNDATYFHMACDAALNTLDLMDRDTKVSIGISLVDEKNPIVLGAWSSRTDAMSRVVKLRREANEGNLKDFSQGVFIPNSTGEEGMAPFLQAIRGFTGIKPDLMLFMHDGGLPDDAMNTEIKESKQARSFPIHFKPFGVRTKTYYNYFKLVPQRNRGDVVLPHDF